MAEATGGVAGDVGRSGLKGQEAASGSDGYARFNKWQSIGMERPGEARRGQEKPN